MGSSDKFCLRWNDFETNISSAFRELRDDADFFDVTLASEDDKQIQAHRLILSACSPFFRRVLKRHSGQNGAAPILYLKGVRYAELIAVLNFMYHGEVNVAQDELNSFLAVAEDLSVKGLTTTNTNTKYNSGSKVRPRPRASSNQQQQPPVKKAKKARDVLESEDIGGKNQEDMPIKTEPRVTVGAEEANKGEGEEGEEQFGEEGLDYEDDYDNDGDFEEESSEASGREPFLPSAPVEGPFKAPSSRRAGTAWTHNGFSYLVNLKKDKVIYLRCRMRGKCKGTASFNEETNEIIERNSHTSRRFHSLKKSRPAEFSVIDQGTTRSAPLFVSNGYGYIKNRQAANRLYLKCRMASRTKCRATAVFDEEDNILLVRGVHICDSLQQEEEKIE